MTGETPLCPYPRDLSFGGDRIGLRSIPEAGGQGHSTDTVFQGHRATGSTLALYV